MCKLSNHHADNNESHDTLYNKYNLKRFAIEPIQQIKYDDFFYNKNSIKHAFLSSNLDRVVFYFNNSKGVYYFENDSDLIMIEYILKSNNINMKLIKDYKREMDSKDGILYCVPNNKNVLNSTDVDTNNYLNIIQLNNVTSKPILVNPIRCIEFDDILYNIKNISHVFLSGNYDRVVVFFYKTKGVYYFKDKYDLDRIEYMMKLNDIKIQIINDYKRIMDTYNGILYCCKNTDIIQEYDDDEFFDIADYIDTDYSDDIDDMNITYLKNTIDYLEDMYKIDIDTLDDL